MTKEEELKLCKSLAIATIIIDMHQLIIKAQAEIKDPLELALKNKAIENIARLEISKIQGLKYKGEK